MKRKSSPGRIPNAKQLAARLSQIGLEFHSRRWALGTSGNYSAVLDRDPLRLLITSSGLDKSALNESQFLQIDAAANLLSGKAKPSAESLLHVAIAKTLPVGCVLHVHSVWNTLLSERYSDHTGMAIAGYEMLKGLEGVTTHAHREWIPILENSQDISALAVRVSELLQRQRDIHGFLLSGHGLYTWGSDIAEARRHVEIFEFLFEVVGRREFSGAVLQEA
jgi:methylthioribulose-1-phosphate dehydratase